MLGWLLDFIPLWIWLALACAALLAAWRILGTRGVIAAGTAVAGFLAYRTGRQSGGDAARAKQAAKEQKARDISDEVDNDIGAMPPEQAREELKKWSR